MEVLPAPTVVVIPTELPEIMDGQQPSEQIPLEQTGRIRKSKKVFELPKPVSRIRKALIWGVITIPIAGFTLKNRVINWLKPTTQQGSTNKQGLTSDPKSFMQDNKFLFLAAGVAVVIILLACRARCYRKSSLEISRSKPPPSSPTVTKYDPTMHKQLSIPIYTYYSLSELATRFKKSEGTIVKELGFDDDVDKLFSANNCFMVADYNSGFPSDYILIQPKAGKFQGKYVKISSDTPEYKDKL